MTTRILACALLVMNTTAASAAKPVTEQQTWVETYAVSGPAPRLTVSNIWGSVRVRAGAPGNITVAVNELRSAPDQARFERSLDVLRLDVEADASGVSLLVGERDNRRQHRNDCRECRVDYQFEIEVPPDAVIDVGTVMDGKVDIEGVAGAISASNVNGPINITGLRECEAVSSVNGPITMDYSQAPVLDCRIETINGDVTLDVPADAGLDMALNLFNGAVSSALPVGPFELPATVEQIVEDERTRYRIQQLAGMRIGAGGPVYSITSMNGDLRIRKHQ
jgi:hypothetical protein